MDSRAKFELWAKEEAKKTSLGFNDLTLERDYSSPDYYAKLWVNAAWRGWQANRQALEGEAVDVERIADTVRDHLGDIFACTRVWSAWQVGTMTQNDFTPADETELADEIATAVATLYTHPASADKQAVSVPSILYDGYAVFQEVQHARNSKGLENIKDSELVSDVLDAVVKLIKQEKGQ